MTGHIVRLVSDRAFGFITGFDGVDRFFLHSACVDVTFAELRQYDPVDFESEETPRGPRAVNVRRSSVSNEVQPS